MKTTLGKIYLFAIVLLLVSVLIGWLLKYVFAGVTVSVIINYNVGAIVAAILGGSGAAAAGFGYAHYKFKS